MKAFVTGGTGVVGRTFLPKLLDAGWEVTALTRDPQKAGLLRHEHLAYLPGDVSDATAMQKLIETPYACDVVFHLAASLDYFGPLDKLLAVNADGTASMARFAQKAKAKRFVYASSIEAAGAFSADEIPTAPERAHPPLTAYGASKIVAEKHALELARSGISSICLRIGNVYGPGWYNFLVEFADSLLKHGRLWAHLHLYGDRYLSPIWNDDVADGLLAAAKSTPTGIENMVGQAATIEEMFHLCADAMGKPFSRGVKRPADWLYVIYYSRWMSRMSGSGNEYSYLVTPKWPRIHRCFAMEASSQRLGWRPQMSLRDGIRKNLEWARTAGLLHY